MLSIISVLCAVVGYLLFFLTKMIGFPVVLIAIGFILSLVDLVSLYTKEKLQFGDFVKEAFHSKWGSVIAFLAGINFIWLIIVYI
ncbi:MAG: hypothetical protein ACI4RM_02840 [Ruminococcus sp.]